MDNKKIKYLEDKYDLELAKIIDTIQENDSKLTLLQFPDGLKSYATLVVDYLRKKTNSEFLVWIDSCFGACDTPILGKEVEKEVDLVIQFGHNSLMPSY